METTLLLESHSGTKVRYMVRRSLTSNPCGPASSGGRRRRGCASGALWLRFPQGADEPALKQFLRGCPDREAVADQAWTLRHRGCPLAVVVTFEIDRELHRTLLMPKFSWRRLCIGAFLAWGLTWVPPSAVAIRGSLSGYNNCYNPGHRPPLQFDLKWQQYCCHFSQYLNNPLVS